MARQREKKSPVDTLYPPTTPPQDPVFPGCSAAANNLNAQMSAMNILTSGINTLRDQLPIALGACIDSTGGPNNTPDGKPDSTFYWWTSQACRDYTAKKYELSQKVAEFERAKEEYKTTVETYNKNENFKNCPPVPCPNNNKVELPGFQLPTSINVPEFSLTDLQSCIDATQARILAYTKEKVSLEEFKTGLDSMLNVLESWPMGPDVINAPEFVEYNPSNATHETYKNTNGIFRSINPDGTINTDNQFIIVPKGGPNNRWTKTERAAASQTIFTWAKQALESFSDINIRETMPEAPDLEPKKVMQIAVRFEKGEGLDYANPSARLNFATQIVGAMTAVDGALIKTEDVDDYVFTIQYPIPKTKAQKKAADALRIKLASLTDEGGSFHNYFMEIGSAQQGLDLNEYLQFVAKINKYFYKDVKFGSEKENGVQAPVLNHPERIKGLNSLITKLNPLLLEMKAIKDSYPVAHDTAKKIAVNAIQKAILDNQKIVVTTVTISYTIADQVANNTTAVFSVDKDKDKFISVINNDQNGKQMVSINMDKVKQAIRDKTGSNMNSCPPTTGNGAWILPITCTVIVKRQFHKAKAEEDLDNAQINNSIRVNCNFGSKFYPTIFITPSDATPGWIYSFGININNNSTKLKTLLPAITETTATVTTCEGAQ
jgi:hypothetical protein